MTPFGLARRARGERDQCRAGRVGGDGAGQRLIGQQVVEAVLMLLARPLVGPDKADDRHVRAQVRLILHPPELLGGDEHLRPRRGDDVAQFLAAVEVHDRHHDGTEEGRGPERHRRLHPVRQLNRDGVARPDTTRAQAGGQPAGMQTRHRRRCPRRAEPRSAPRSRWPGWRQGRRRSDHRASRAATTLRPRSVSSALQGFFASRAAAPPFGRDAILR